MEPTYIAYAENELTEHLVYGKLATMEKKPANRALLEKLSAQEKSHYEFWKSLVPNEDIKPRTLGLVMIPALRAILGVTFTAKLLESHEKDAVLRYQKLLPHIPASHRARFEEIIKDEQSHEQSLIAEVKERRIAYLGFIALGLADAIVEITGVHAGFLGVTGSTLIAGVSGIIVGFAAAISMGSASYLQAKQNPETSAIISGFATGISYLASVVCLALPYFLISTMLTAFVVSTSVGIILLAGFTFYGAIIFDRVFLREFGESVSLMLGTALATFLLGNIVGKVFHINNKNF
jgi:VIT1/CCC1 family predicted Fe2+/Mn2+ transporter